MAKTRTCNGGYAQRKTYGKTTQLGKPRTPKPTYKQGGTSPKPTAKRRQDGTRAN